MAKGMPPGRPPGTPAGQPATRALGNAGERLAATWLEARGHQVLARNWHSPYGEIDIITREGDELVFVEVKTRRGDAHGAPEEAVTPRKQAHLIAAAQLYLMEYLEQHGSAAPVDARIDVVAVRLSPGGRLLDIRHYRGAVAQEE